MSDVRLDLTEWDALVQQHPQRVEDWLDGVAQEIAEDIKLIFGTGPAGRRYKRGDKWHVASRVGYPPNVDTSALQSSIRWQREGPLERRIEDGVEYGIDLEEGTETNGGARPFIQPVFDEWAQKIGEDAARNLRLEG